MRAYVRACVRVGACAVVLYVGLWRGVCCVYVRLALAWLRVHGAWRWGGAGGGHVTARVGWRMARAAAASSWAVCLLGGGRVAWTTWRVAGGVQQSQAVRGVGCEGVRSAVVVSGAGCELAGTFARGQGVAFALYAVRCVVRVRGCR